MISSSNSIDYSGERMIPGYADAQTYWEHIYRYRFVLPRIKNKRVLDIACGVGYGSAAMLHAGASSVIGIDISPTACQHAKSIYGVDARIGDALEISLPPHSIDTIVSFETIEHLKDPEQFIQECKRVLKPNGILIISTPNINNYRNECKKNIFHINELSKDEFFSLIKNYFAHVKKYSQQPRKISWVSIRPLSSSNSPWLRLRGMYRLRKNLIRFTCPQVQEKQYGGDAVNQILQRDPFISCLVNPFLVGKELRDESPVYLIAVANN